MVAQEKDLGPPSIGELLPLEEITIYISNDRESPLVAKVANTLKERVVGQDEACEVVARHVVMAEAGIVQPDRPKAVLFFLGPKGTGKTSMAKALAYYMFGEEAKKHLKIIPCGEFEDSHSVYLLIGAPPGYIGHDDPPLISAEFLQKPNIVVFDEIEKADFALTYLLLNIMEEGKMMVSQPSGPKSAMTHEVSFGQSILIFTSNIGSEDIQKYLKGTFGFVSSDQPVTDKSLESTAHRALRRYYMGIPEFIDRVDDIVVFKQLRKEHYLQIFQIAMAEQNGYMREQFIAPPMLKATERLAQYIVDKLDVREGARQMRHVLKRTVWTPLADLFLNQDMSGKEIQVDIVNGQIQFSYLRAQENTSGPTPKKPSPELEKAAAAAAKKKAKTAS